MKRKHTPASKHSITRDELIALASLVIDTAILVAVLLKG